MNNAIKLTDVTFSYDGKVNVLQNTDFTANYGEVLLVAGHSGEGKSTLLSIISGIIPNVVTGNLSGEVEIDGVSIIGKRLGDVCRKVGVVLQNADEQIVHKIVEDEISFGCENLAYPPDIIDQQIDAVVKLMDLKRNDKTRTLSGGQKQRLITASTLAMGQKIIILDEPLANLDFAGSNKLMSTLKSLAKAGYCVVVVEHRLDMVLAYVDKVFHIGDGKITEVADKQAYLVAQTTKIDDTSTLAVTDEKMFEIKNLKFVVDKREILSDVSCDIIKGARTVLLGENGCGKSTLLRVLARLYKPTSGSVTQYLDPKFAKKYKGTKEWFKRVGVVYQNPDYQLFMPTVKKELCFGAPSEEYAMEIAQMFGIVHLLSRHPQSLSQGQKRRVSIASVVATKPEVLLLDEPTVGQDYEGLEKLVKILNNLHSKGNFTLITITHDIRCAEALCDNALLLCDGVIKAKGGKQLVRDYFAQAR